MKRTPEPADLIRATSNQAEDNQAGNLSGFAEILGLMASSVGADVIQLGLDLGHGYYHDCYIDIPCSDSQPQQLWISDSTRWDETATLGWVLQRALPAGTAWRRRAPRSRIALLRSPARPAFDTLDRQHLSQLLPHLNQALALAHALVRSRQCEAIALTALDHIGCGVLLLSAANEVLHINARARVLLDQARVQYAPRLRLPSHALQQRLDTSLASAARGESSMLHVPAPAPLVFNIQPATPDAQVNPLSPITITLTSPLSSLCALSSSLLQHYSLTPAEFRVCQALSEGRSLKMCAQNWNRSYDTLRSQLKAILAKTGTHRQAELVALLDAFRQR